MLRTIVFASACATAHAAPIWVESTPTAAAARANVFDVDAESDAATFDPMAAYGA